MTAFVRVSGPANGNFLIGYPGISATMVSADLESSLRAGRLVDLVVPGFRAAMLSSPSS
jgi:hypothetical protein